MGDEEREGSQERSQSEGTAEREERQAPPPSGDVAEARDTLDQERAEMVGVPEATGQAQRAAGLYSVEEERLAEGYEGAGGDRFRTLLEKRRRSGLSNEEADELGKLMAEREGQQYVNPRSGDEQAKAEEG